MSQFSHDEFDEVQPYRADEVGKHRAPGAPPAAAAASSGMLKWIGVAVVAVLLIAAVGWFVTRDAGDDDAPVAEEQDAAEQADEGEGNGGDGDENGDDGADEGEPDENGENGEVEENQAAAGLNDEYPVRAVNAGAPDGSAQQLTSELDELGLDVEQSIDWDFANWGTPNTPQVIYPAEEQQELAEAIAEELNIDNVSQGGSWQTIVVIVGPEYQ